ncbi:hypothetical protein [Thiohalocapsa sp.]|jgi:hypothetical protein|uniref:hypothetical protein n=1 Tax=Thiohalocapsa sp. TaxID=2497641 RepID=UPI0025FC6BE2|nr:hypothetical protein [Thiohalocapsa sp.]
MAASDYPVHRNIKTTVFWVGEKATNDNSHIPNSASSWDRNWKMHYGGYDDPNSRSGYRPKKFTPKENPFYFALPYDDLLEDGRPRQSAYDEVYWAEDEDWSERGSMLKNRWIQIKKGGRVAYAQWQDVGPYLSHDVNYVFGSARPKNKIGVGAGLDVSPAVRDYLKIDNVDTVDWRFVDDEDVPDGPWTKVITTRGVSW